jgi:hypothetical protein
VVVYNDDGSVHGNAFRPTWNEPLVFLECRIWAIIAESRHDFKAGFAHVGDFIWMSGGDELMKMNLRKK